VDVGSFADELQEILGRQARLKEGLYQGREIARQAIMRKDAEIKALKRQVEEREAETEEAQRRLKSVEMEKDRATIASIALKKDYDDLSSRLEEWKLASTQGSSAL